jgi:hypothetical protein
MLLHGRAPRWLIYVTTAIVALLWVGAFFVLRRAGAISPGGLEWSTAPPLCPRISGVDAWSQSAGVVGVYLNETELVEPALSRALELLDQNGVRWVRLTLPWDRLEPARGSFDWAWSDRIFAALAGHPAIQPVVVLDRSPAWARAAADSENAAAPPHERADFGAFAAEAAKRYGLQVQYYQVWNEPNIAPHWGARPVDPADYLGLLREASVQIRAADPDAQIVLAGLAPTLEQGGANLSDLAYLDALYRYHARPWFDVVAAQPFGFSQAASAPAGPGSLNYGRAALLRQVMNRHGDVCTPLWATTFGWNAPPGGAGGSSSPWGQVTEAEQASFLRDAVEIATTGEARLGPLFWAAFCPGGAGDDPWRGFSLCTAMSDLSAGAFGPRPSWTALLEATASPAILPAGAHPVDHPALHYEGQWRIRPSAADPGRDGDRVTFDFSGTDLALRVQGGPYWALYRVWVDDGPANALPRDESGVSYLVLHDPSSEIRSIRVASGLSKAVHRVRLEAVGGWGQWALQGVSIGDFARVARWPGWLLLGLAAFATAVWGGLVWSQRRPQAATAATAGEHSTEVTSLPPRWLDQAILLGGRWLWVAAIGLLLLMAFSPWLLLDLAAIAGLGILFLIRPDLSLPLIAASIPFVPRPVHLLRWEFSIFEILVWLAAAALVARWAAIFLSSALSRPLNRPRTGRFTFHPSGFILHVRGLDWPVLAVLGLGLVSALFAQRGDVALREYRTVFLEAVLFYWLVTRVPAPLRQGKGSFSPWPVMNGLIAGAVIVSFVAIWQLATGQGRVDVEGVWRVRAFYGSPNNLALLLDRVIPLALAIAAFGGKVGIPPLGSGAHGKMNVGMEPSGRSMREGERPAEASSLAQRVVISGARGVPLGVLEGKPVRWIYGLAALVMAIACTAAFSKGALLLGLPVGVGLVLVVGAWRAQRRWPLALLAGLVALGIAGLAWLARTPRFADLLNFTAGTSFFRLKLWQGAWHMALDHPWLGVGPDNFLYAYRTRYVLPSAWQELNLSHPHNILLDLWTRLGIPGLVVGLWAIWAGARYAWALLRSPDEVKWPIALGLLGGLAVTVAHGLIDNSLFLVDLMAIFMLSLGLLQRLTSEGRD